MVTKYKSNQKVMIIFQGSVENVVFKRTVVTTVLVRLDVTLGSSVVRSQPILRYYVVWMSSLCVRT